MLQYKPQGKPSRRGALFRELIAAGVKATGGDILQFAKKYEKMAPKSLPIPHGWHFEKEKLSSGGFVEYLEPKNCRRKDVVIMQLHAAAATRWVFCPNSGGGLKSWLAWAVTFRFFHLIIA